MLTQDFVYYADPSGFILFPLVVHSFDLIISSVGILSIKGTRDASVKSPVEDPMAVLQKGYSLTIVLAVLTFGAVIVLFLMFLLSFRAAFLFSFLFQTSH